jgi:HAD superfamily hydrolase (TIGR01484 family)
LKYTHVIFDLDGTLIPDNKALDQNELKLLGEQLRVSGLLVLFATGRSLAKVIALEGVVKALSPIAIVANCGAEIFLNRDGEFIRDTGYFQNVESRGCLFERVPVEAYLGEFDFLTLQESKYQFDYKISYYIDLNKCVSVRSFIDDFKARFIGHELLISLAKIEAGIHYLDIQSVHATKYAALAYMLKNIGVEERNVKYFGDNGNDLPCVLGFERASMISTYKDRLVGMYPELLCNNISWLENSGPSSLLENLELLE